MIHFVWASRLLPHLAPHQTTPHHEFDVRCHRPLASCCLPYILISHSFCLYEDVHIRSLQVNGYANKVCINIPIVLALSGTRAVVLSSPLSIGSLVSLTNTDGLQSWVWPDWVWTHGVWMMKWTLLASEGHGVCTDLCLRRSRSLHRPLPQKVTESAQTFASRNRCNVCFPPDIHIVKYFFVQTNITPYEQNSREGDLTFTEDQQ